MHGRLDMDKEPDLLYRYRDKICFIKGSQAGPKFYSSILQESCFYPLKITSIDVNADGISELAINCEGKGIWIVSFKDLSSLRIATLPSFRNLVELLSCDIQGDGFPELIAVYNSLAFLFLNNGGKIEPKGFLLFFPTYKHQPGSLACVDINGDGILDVVDSDVEDLQVFYGDNMTVSPQKEPEKPEKMLVGEASGTLSPVSYPLGHKGKLACGDFDGDGRKEVALFDFEKSIILIFSGDKFRQIEVLGRIDHLPRITSDLEITAGDLDSDGKSELILCGHSRAWVFKNKGKFDFQMSEVSYDRREIPGFSFHDFDGDGKKEVLFPDFSIGRYDGRERIETIRRYYLGEELPHNGANVADFDGDGRLDVAVPGEHVKMCRGLGELRFEAPQVLACASDSSDKLQATVGDFDGDGRQDLFYIEGSGSKQVLLLNRSEGELKFEEKVLEESFRLISERPNLAPYDVNMDGYTDVFVISQGFTFLYQGSSEGLKLAPWVTNGLFRPSYWFLSYAGNFVGDEATDLLYGVRPVFLAQGEFEEATFVRGDVNGDGRQSFGVSHLGSAPKN